jgi:prolyl-tRNA synthetase
MKLALEIYEDLQDAGIEVLLDDRDERAGVKFKDADLTGMPLSIIIGKNTLAKKKVEIKARKDKKVNFADAKNIAKKASLILKKY